jgi:predicted lipoprotein with Yx(FWY)xxD motif
MVKGKNLVIAAILAVACVGGAVWAASYYYQSSSASASAADLFRDMNGTPLLGVAGKSPAGEASGEDDGKPLALKIYDDPKLGARLVAPDGRALYHFANDSSGVSACTGNCATNWPPYIVKADDPLTGGTGIRQEISTVIRPEGPLQATYGGKPLYFWHNDKGEGDTGGQGVGGVWFVALP